MLVSIGISQLLLACSLASNVAKGHQGQAAGQKRQLGGILSSLGLAGSATGSGSTQPGVSLSLSLPQVTTLLFPTGPGPSSQAPSQDTPGLPPESSSELPSQVTSSPSVSLPITSSASLPSSASSSSGVSSSSSTSQTSSTVRSTSTRVSTFTTPLVSNEVRSTVYRTVFTSNGAAVTSSFSANSTIPHTTGYATVTQTAALNEAGNDGSSSSGLSDSSKKIIGGVVGGVGGAIFLGAIAAVAWRLRKRRNVQPDPYVYDNVKEDYSSGPSSHYPSGNSAVVNPTRVNQSSNF